MFEKVITKNDLESFNYIWKSGFSKNHYELDDFHGHAKRFLIHNKYGDVRGTVEVLPFSKDVKKSTIQDMFDFSTLEVVKSVPLEEIYEIDKLSVLESYDKIGTLENILQTVVLFAKENNISYYFALVNPILFRALRTTYQFNVEKAGKIIRTDEYDVQPMYIDMKAAISNKDAWYNKELTKV